MNKIVEINIHQNGEAFTVRFVRGKRGMYKTKKYTIPTYQTKRLFWLTFWLDALCTVKSAMLVDSYDKQGNLTGVWSVAYIPKRSHK
mgnify:CR=1 FL=1